MSAMSSTQLLTEKRELLDNLQVTWKSFRRLENVTESTGKRRRLERLQDRLSDLMNELEGIQ